MINSIRNVSSSVGAYFLINCRKPDKSSVRPFPSCRPLKIFCSDSSNGKSIKKVLHDDRQRQGIYLLIWNVLSSSKIWNKYLIGMIAFHASTIHSRDWLRQGYKIEAISHQDKQSVCRQMCVCAMEKRCKMHLSALLVDCCSRVLWRGFIYNWATDVIRCICKAPCLQPHG
jgi:hypothetical protein